MCGLFAFHGLWILPCDSGRVVGSRLGLMVCFSHAQCVHRWLFDSWQCPVCVLLLLRVEEAPSSEDGLAAPGLLILVWLLVALYL